MQSLATVNQSVFVNAKADRVDHKHSKGDDKVTQDASKKALEGELLKIGDSVTYAQAEDLFDRVNVFQSLSYQTQHGLQAYTSHELDRKRETLKQMMGVDLYA